MNKKNNKNINKETKEKSIKSDDFEFIQENDTDNLNKDPLNKIKELKEKLKASDQTKQEYLNGWQKERADFVNFKKDETKRTAELLSFSKANFINEILTVVDSFDMAFANKKAWQEVPKNWGQGIEYIYNQLLAILEKEGLRRINDVNIPFDPAQHHSIETIKVDKKEDDGKVLEIIQSGYILEDKVIRAARVKVGKSD